jgi:hypothetical protein
MIFPQMLDPEQRSDGGEPEYLAGAAVLSIPGFG